MKIIIQSMFLIWFSLGWSVNCLANPLENTGINLLRACNNVDKIIESKNSDVDELMSASWCIGVVSTARDLASGFTTSGLLDLNMMVCLPKSGVGNEQAIKIVTRYLEENPQKLHFPATILAFVALKDAFPCSSQENME